jgi:hypothetical protein
MTHSHNDGNLKHWCVQGRIAVPPDDTLKKEILHRFHDLEIRGHQGRDPTITIICRHFWWPNMNEWIAQYVKGCAKCQQGKNLTKRTKVPLYQIPTPTDTLPFQIVAMDLITQLPISNGYDAILMIVDHRCTRAAVFLPCKTTITGQEVAKLYYNNIYRWFGLPNKVISDRDPPIHVPLRKSPHPATGDQTKRVLSIPPPNGRTVRADKSMGRTIPPPDHQQHPDRLE